MEFRILGPLEVLDHGDPVAVRGRKQRALLAVLLLHTNRALSPERLLESLWGDDRPGSGDAAVRVRVSQLRKALGGTEPAWETAGYVLHVEPDRLDALCFERSLAEGRAALAQGDAERASATLRAGLALWRGPALADFADEEFARGESARLEELRLSALEERAEADLALGRHAELVPELEALVAAEPQRERLLVQHMLALYRSGRQADALAAYRATRLTLVEELGIEPGRALQELERAILRQDPALDPAPQIRPPARKARSPERKLVTVLGGDLCDSAALRADDPERTEALLERLHDTLAVEIDAAGGRLEAAGGGAFTAVFGAPVAQDDHAERALHAALALRRTLEERFGDDVSLRAGVATGHVVAGDERISVGKPVATATRLAHAARAGSILVGPRAAAASRSAFELGAPEEPHGCRPLLRALAATSAPASGTPFVGRDAELDSLLVAYRHTVRERRPQLVTVHGDAGVGKTRLVRELWERLADETPLPLRRTGRCYPYGRATTYRPLADVLREELGLLETDSEATVRERLGERAVLGLALGIDLEPERHPLAARERLQVAWAELLTELAAAQPAVVLVEDLHWAQEPLLDLIERLLETVDGPLLVVCTARPELSGSRPSWGRRRNASTIWLEPLAEADAQALVADLDLEPELRERVIERAEGNPFFLEELLASLADTRAPEIPDSVQAVLATRIDLLPPAEKEALQAASVIGRIFWRGPVRALLDGVLPDFSVLESRDFIRRRSGSSLADEREFAFKHALTRDVAYASIPRGRRARLHADFADWLEELGAGRDQHAPLLAHHYAEAVCPAEADRIWTNEPAELERLTGRAVAWLRRAAELATRRYDLDEALALVDRALALAPAPPVELELWRLAGRANALRHDGAPFLAAMLRALELAPDRATAAELYADLSFETALRAGMWRQRPDRELVDGWIERARELSEPGSAARARALIARCEWAPVGSEAEAREASAIADALGDVELRSYAWDARGITAWVSGHPDLGRGWEERRFELVDRIHDPDHVADVHYAPVTGCVWLGYFKEARRLARRHDEITSPLTPHHRIHGVAVRVEVEELAAGWERIRELEPRVEENILGNLETPCVRSPRSLLVCALAELALGDPAKARVLEEAAETFEMQGYGHVLDTPRLRLALLRGDLETVERLDAVPLPDRGWHRGWLLLSTESARLDGLAALGRSADLEAWPAPRPGTYLEPFYLRALGRVREDPALLERAEECFAALRLPWHLEQTRALLPV